MSAKTHRFNMVWIDMEMTGLDPVKDRIIEIASIVTDGQLNILAEGPNLVIHQPERLIRGMDQWNQEHHSKSGLIADVRNSTVTVKAAEKMTLEFLKEYCKPKKAPLCGNSVHHDRRFLARDMPAIDDYLHYRHVDVSTIKALVARWYPKDKEPPKGKSHRALSDIRESIEELRFYRERYFK
ncbi:MAG: Oligoribonuclease [Candidatus Omnitrophica bacterium ADurb.Bin292]|jgi:oligoribonuclease|nr:MAG: Oligoribonuclease [Candidatus Omnitrophica bacterium ADurb.Bin292]HOG23945.1 oligoribonuclease [Candidatus Omnitrophota bacterium]HPW76813.1 oligoribonuclease [Candidatus Omnitrophota bacterium]HQB12051.1 oligoribonuclease [Candidatus Omnitrophota bacterium]